MTFKPLTGRDRDFLRLLLPAARAGKIEAMEAYLEERPAWLRRVGPHGRTLLWEAARGGRAEMVEWLADRGADIEALGCYYRETRVELSPWCVATLRKKPKVVAALESRGARYDLISACYLGDRARVDVILAEDPEAAARPVVREHRWNPYHEVPVSYAVAAGEPAIVRRLLECGATFPEPGLMAFRWAIENDDRETVDMLIAHGFDPSTTKDRDWAREPKWRDIAARFAVASSIDTPNRLGFPPLVDACRGNHNAPDDPDRVEALLAEGASVAARDYKEKTALHRAAQAGFVEIGRVLLRAGADLEAADAAGETPLFDAIRAGRAEMVRWMLSEGARPDAENARGNSARQVAARVKTRDAEGVRRALRAFETPRD